MSLASLALEPSWLFAAAFAAGIVAGSMIARWAAWLVGRGLNRCRACGETLPRRRRLPILGPCIGPRRCPACGERLALDELLVQLGTALAFSVFVGRYLLTNCQDCPEVAPSPVWQIGRLVSQLMLISLLIAATVTDLYEYVIPDAITIPGTIFAVAVATASGDTQIIHVWVDWTRENVGQYGPYLPHWLKNHPHWHGLAWSLAGATAGAGITALTRLIASLILRQEALGFGDVTLMAMIGAFMGWQPVVFVFLLAPFCGVVIAVLLRLLSNRSFVPYGPFLAGSAFVVLCFWRSIWMWEPAAEFRLRDLLGDPVALGILAGVAIVLFTVLLGVLRLYRTIPTGKRKRTTNGPERQ
jgi:leader peptidase (prepilin peptidase)/N-methyltransferase